MDWINPLFKFIVVSSAVDFLLLAICDIAIRFLRQPVERIRLIQITLLCSLVSLFVLQAGWNFTVELPWLPATNAKVTIASRQLTTSTTGSSGVSASPIVKSASLNPDVPKTASSKNHDNESSHHAQNAAHESESNPQNVTVLTDQQPNDSQVASDWSWVISFLGGWPLLKILYVICFLAVSLIQAIRLIIGFWITKRLIQSAQPLSAEQESTLRLLLGNPHRKIQLASTDRIDVPIVHGVFNPMIVLPGWLLERGESNSQVLRHSLIHEWKHIENHDLVTWHLMSLCQVFFWHQPHYWQLRKTLRVSQDQLADQYAAFVESNTTGYAETLVSLAKSKQPELYGALAMAGTSSQPKSNLYRRIEMLLNESFTVATTTRKAVVAGFSCSLIALSVFLTSLQLTPAIANTAGPLVQEVSTQKEEPAQTITPTATINVNVKDENGQPISNAELKVMLWTSEYEQQGETIRTDGEGDGTVKDIKLGGYLYLHAGADEYATTSHTLNLESGDTHSIELILSRTVQSWITIKSTDGAPVVGAEIQRIDYLDLNKNQVIIQQKNALSMGVEFSESDEQGDMQLPLLPINSKVTLWVVHPAWKVAKITDLTATSGKLAEVTLESGPRISIRFHSDSTSKEELEGTPVDILFKPADQGSSGAGTIWHTFPIRDGQVNFTAHPESYNDLRVDVDGFFSTPQYRIYPPEPRLELTKRESSTFDVVLLPKAKARGRVVDADGNGKPNVWVTSSSTGLIIDSTNEETGEIKTSVSEEPNLPAGSGHTDAQGYYEVEVAVGKCSAHVIDMGSFTKPLHTLFEVTSLSETAKIPDITLFPVPKLNGKIVGADGSPLPNAVVRMCSLGSGDADPVGITDAEGNFELTMTRIPYAPGGGLQTEVYVVAFDPNGKFGGLAPVDLMDDEAVGKIEVQLEEKEDDWIVHPLKEFRKDADGKETRMAGQVSDEVAKTLKARFASLREKYADGMPGKPVPTMKEGTWLNTDATSLEDFKGSYVLIDFWFIGCGPCHRDMPSVRICHKAFADRGFSVVSVHTNMQKPDAVQKFADNAEMNYPIVVDNADGDIIKAYEKLGLSGYPNYILIDPDGKIIVNDSVPDGSAKYSLRSNKIEAIYQVLNDANHRTPKAQATPGKK